MQDVGGGDFACDLAEVVDGEADILAQQVRRQAIVQPVECRLQRRTCLAQGVVVALVRYDSLAAVCRRGVHRAAEGLGEDLYACPCLG